MNSTVTPAYRPTARSIWNSFLASGRRHLILTGDRRSGKTTLLTRLLPLIDPTDNLPGLTTWAQPGNAVWLQENHTGQRAEIGRFDPALPGPENRMRPVPEGFLTLGLPALQRCEQAAGEWVSIDEIGYLESCCPEYGAAILDLMQHKRLAAVVRRQDLPFLQALCRREDVFCVNLDAPFGKAGCVIMASGLGQRFGGNKLMAPLGDRPMLQWVLDATSGIFDRRVVVTRSPEVERLCREQNVPVLLHTLPYRSDTVRLGLKALLQAGPMSGCVFCPGDQPLLRRQTVASLALCAAADPDAIWRTAWQGQPGAPVMFPAWTFEELGALPQGCGGGAVVRRYPAQVRLLTVEDGRELADVDTRQQLEALRTLVGTGQL